MKVFDFFNDTKGEMKHVSWPTRRQAIWYTMVVVVISLVIAIILGFFDFAFSRLLDKLII